MTNIGAWQGRLTATPELKHTPNDIAVISFTIANDVGFGDNKKTNFLPVVAWRNTAEFVEKYLGKGDLINITGELQQRKYTDKDGNNRSVIEIVASKIDFCGGKQEDKPKANTSNDDFEEVEGGDDLPF